MAAYYEVFLVSRMREAYVHGDSPAQAVTTGFRPNPTSRKNRYGSSPRCRTRTSVLKPLPSDSPCYDRHGLART